MRRAKPADPERPLCGRDAICTFLGISPRTLYRLREKGLPVRYCGGLRAYPSSLQEWVKSQPVKR